ncbi:long-chain-fatty-acid--CoA ligase [Phenylobacterium sp.]|uniref:long-chain-fatty-acid--CoA ligase n=1 Tax=Phenylobacterium sp. TaxID=1871053 RepID=UPI00301CDFC3
MPDIVRAHARWRPQATALEFEGRSVTFADLDAATDRLAAGLRALGVGSGDRVAYLGRNSDRFFELMFAANKLAAVITPLNWRLAPPEIAYILDDAEPAVTFVGEACDGLWAQASALARTTTRVLPLGEATAGDLADLIGQAAAGFEATQIDPEQAAILLYTSGTTGRPKGAMLSHRSLVELRRREAVGPDWLRWQPPEVCLVSMPLFHISGIRLGVAALFNGCHVLVIPEFDAARVLTIIHTRDVTRLLLVPAAMQMLARHPDAARTDFSRIKYVYYGGSPISPALLSECISVFGCGFVQSYGSTETCGLAAVLGPEDHHPVGGPKMNSVGTGRLGVEIRITSPDGRILPAKAFGEVNIRSPGNMSGYWRMPEETAATLSADGWIRTGDGGLIDEDGYLFLKDRIKDMIITGGENVYPTEVENVLAAHPSVAEVGVFGVPSERWGEEVRAAVVLRPGARASEADLVAWARERLAGYKTPKQLRLVDALPRNAGGKILKRELRRLHADVTPA